MVLHYYDEEDIDIGKPVSCKVVVNHTVELTEEEKSRGTAERHTEGRERSLRQVGESQVQTQENRR